MVKVTALYGHPESPEAFEKHYAATHVPLAKKIPGLVKLELTSFLPGPDGTKPAYYRMAELYFAGPAEVQHAIASPEGQATTSDLANFATGGVTLLVGGVQE
jgi:uncharacterized protein (TIGR02118 family)